MAQLTLYYRPFCPFCRKVIQFMEQEDLHIPLKSIQEDSKNLEELVEIGEKSQVPCLVIDGKALYESDDIIEWLRANALSQH